MSKWGEWQEVARRKFGLSEDWDLTMVRQTPKGRLLVRLRRRYSNGWYGHEESDVFQGIL